MKEKLTVEYVEDKPYCFISYKSEDAEIVDEYCRILNSYNFRMWHDHGIPKNKDWEAVISSKIAGASNILFFISINTFLKNSTWVRTEYDLAEEYKDIDAEGEVQVVFLDNPKDIKAAFIEAGFRDKYMVWIKHMERLQGTNAYNYDNIEDACFEIMDGFDFKYEKNRFLDENTIPEHFETGDIFEFGHYPVKLIDNVVLKSKLNSHSDFKSYKYFSGTGNVDDGSSEPGDFMLFCDVTLDKKKYRGVYIDKYRPNYIDHIVGEKTSFQHNNGFETETTYWFEYEPLKWQVLDAEKGLVLCTKAVDAQSYTNCLYGEGADAYGHSAFWGNKNKSFYANNYFNSSIRAWLNNEFYNTAFTDKQKEKVKISKLNNNACSSEYSDYDSKESKDFVFLLSYSEAQQYQNVFDLKIKNNTSDYAKIQGLMVSNSSHFFGNSSWLLRSAGYWSDLSAVVDYRNHVSDNADTNATFFGIRPAFTIVGYENNEMEQKENEQLEEVSLNFKYKLNFDDKDFIIKDRVLLSYKGNNEVVHIPPVIDKIANNAFYHCINVCYVYIPDGVREIGYGAFADCKKIRCISMPDSVEIIGDRAFSNDDCIETIKIPRNVKHIKANVFYGCKSLKEVHIPKHLSLNYVDIFKFKIVRY